MQRKENTRELLLSRITIAEQGCYASCSSAQSQSDRRASVEGSMGSMGSVDCKGLFASSAAVLASLLFLLVSIVLAMRSGVWDLRIFALVSSLLALPLFAALILALCSGGMVFPKRAKRFFSRCSGLKGLPIFAALIFLPISGSLFLPVNLLRFVSCTLASCSGGNGRPLILALSLARVSGEGLLPLCASPILRLALADRAFPRSLARCSGLKLLPLSAELNFARVSSVITCLALASLILALVSSLRIFPLLTSESFLLLSSLIFLPIRACAILILCSGVAGALRLADALILALACAVCLTPKGLPAVGERLYSGWRWSI